MSNPSQNKRTLFVSGLSNSVTQTTLHEAFLPFGSILEITIPKPEHPSAHDPHRGFGYVEFEEEEDAKEALYNMDQSEIFGKVLKVAQAKPPKEANEGLGSKTAIWEQEGYIAEQAADENGGVEEDQKVDPMEGLEGLDVAGPKER
ncbi:MAG: hypothetical protein Q9162_006650 [Coniocarpon cinnabarinum]